MAWIQILMDEAQIFKKIIVQWEFLLAVAAEVLRTGNAEKLLCTLRWRSAFKRGVSYIKCVIVDAV